MKCSTRGCKKRARYKVALKRKPSKYVAPLYYMCGEHRNHYFPRENNEEYEVKTLA